MVSKKRKAFAGSVLTLGILGIGGVTASAESIQNIADSAVPVANEYGLYPSVMIAQAILESGSGTSSLASQYNNYFGVKYTSGQGVDLPTTEYIDGKAETVTASFQVYASAYDSFVAHAELLSNYYPGTLVANGTSYQDALNALQGKYATDPNYASLLDNIINTYDLTAYDGGAGATTAAQAQETSSSTGNYIVKSGDSLSTIAAQNGLSVSDLVSLNGIDQKATLQVGQSLSLTGATTTTSGQTANAESTGVYTVKPGDSLWTIAQSTGTTVANLQAINGLDANSLLQEGQQLSLSGDVSQVQGESAPSSSAGTYAVKSGDTLWSIAQSSNRSVEELISLNNLPDANNLAVGQILNI